MTNSEKDYEDRKEVWRARVQKLKLYSDGVTAMPHGIVDILFLDRATGKAAKYTGAEASVGRILIVLPFRTEKYPDKFACYSQPSDWKLKYSKGMMVNAVVEGGEVRKLMPAHQYMVTARILDMESMEVRFSPSRKEEAVVFPKFRSNRPNVEKFEEEKSGQWSQAIPPGFEVDDRPF